VTAQGTVVAAFGRSSQVELADGERLMCVTRGRRGSIACGDRVRIRRTADDQGVIEAVEPRSTLLARSDAHRRKLIAANVDQMVIVVAAVPSWYEELLARAIAAAEQSDLAIVIVLNKADLVEPSRAARVALAAYERIGYDVIPLSAINDVSPLVGRLLGRASVLFGQSGMGKSTLLNALLPGAAAAVSTVSAALDSGKHTTTAARLYRLDACSTLIDCPGLQEYGLHHLDPVELAYGFREFRPYAGQCRFSNCRHQTEPGCALAAAVAAGAIDPRRLELFRRIAAG
jgi:ribosome biogenesis GTPase